MSEPLLSVALFSGQQPLDRLKALSTQVCFQICPQELGLYVRELSPSVMAITMASLQPHPSHLYVPPICALSQIVVRVCRRNHKQSLTSVPLLVEAVLEGDHQLELTDQLGKNYLAHLCKLLVLLLVTVCLPYSALSVSVSIPLVCKTRLDHTQSILQKERIGFVGWWNDCATYVASVCMRWTVNKPSCKFTSVASVAGL